MALNYRTRCSYFANLGFPAQSLTLFDLTRMKHKNIAKRLRFLFGLAAVWLFVAGLLTLLLWPDLPTTDLGWFLLVVVGPPVYVVGEGFFEWLFWEKHNNEISNKQFSWVRGFLAVVIAATFIGLGLFSPSFSLQ